ncbi:MAG: polysaccharide deacetylase family protein [Negativicutes bacterium]|nr:polysaccharide deacetylase family protein [Negativicutes bacterium]
MRKKLIFAALAVFAASLALLATGCLGAGTPVKTAAVKTPGEIAAQPDKPTAVPAGVPVLMYHSVGPERNNDAVISKERFAEHMAFLRQENFQPISLDELHAYLTEKKPLPLKPVVLTFDDGYPDTYEVVYPLLKQYGFKSTLFMITDQIGKRLTPEQLKEMKAGGMEIAPHTHTHRELTGLSPREQAEEIMKSKEILDRILGQDSRHFCYPNGSYNAETLRLLKEAGFKTAVTINPGWTKPGDNVLALNRVWMGNGVDLKHLRERLSRPDYPML